MVQFMHDVIIDLEHDERLGSAPTDTGQAGVVLVVDDEPSNVMLLEAVLEPHGHRVIGAQSGPAALRSLESETPDAVVLDVMMPGFDGHEVCRRIRSCPRTALTPVVMLSALTSQDDRIAGLRSGADEFMSKPFDATELVVRLAGLIDRHRMQQRRDSTESVIEALLAALQLKDPHTGDHSRRLATATVEFGRFLQLEATDLEVLGWAGLLHDVGKVGVPDELLGKTGPLSTAEWQVMRRHTEFGESLLRPLETLAPVLPIVRHHHERWDGLGYPDGIRAERIPLLARVLQLVDAYDALTSERPYKPAWSRDRALVVMSGEAGSRFDPELFTEFERAVGNGMLDALGALDTATARPPAGLSR